jgi:hypothetical protein
LNVVQKALNRCRICPFKSKFNLLERFLAGFVNILLEFFHGLLHLLQRIFSLLNILLGVKLGLLKALLLSNFGVPTLF